MISSISSTLSTTPSSPCSKAYEMSEGNNDSATDNIIYNKYLPVLYVRDGVISYLLKSLENYLKKNLSLSWICWNSQYSSSTSLECSNYIFGRYNLWNVERKYHWMIG